MKAEGKTTAFWQCLDPRVKMLCVFSWLAAVVVTPVYHYQKFLAYTVIIILLGVMARVRVKYYLLRFIFLIPLLIFIGVSLLVFSQQEWPQKAMIFFNLIVKTFLTFCGIGLLVLTVQFNHMLKSLETIKFPGVFTTLLAFAYRYVFLFQQEAGRMITARKARTFGRHKTWKERKMAAAVIPYFLFRVLERSQRVYVAMLSRGYRDLLPAGISTALTLTGADYLFGSLFHLLLVCVFILP
jgi:cobalt/nickel transport system permease protein